MLTESGHGEGEFKVLEHGGMQDAEGADALRFVADLEVDGG